MTQLMLIRGRSVQLWLLLAILGQLAIRAVLGGATLVLAPSGASVGLSTTALAGTPFLDYRVPGAILFVLFGLGPIVTIVALYTDRWWGWIGSVAVGTVLLGWIVVEVALGFERPTLYINLATGVAILVLATYSIVLQDSPAAV